MGIIIENVVFCFKSVLILINLITVFYIEFFRVYICIEGKINVFFVDVVKKVK